MITHCYKNLMRKVFISSLFFLFFLFSLSFGAKDENDVIRGQIVSPLLNSQGELQYFYKKGDSGIHLATHGMTPKHEKIEYLIEREESCFPVIKRDRNDRIHLLWAENKNEESVVFSGIIQNSKLSKRTILYKGKGTVHSLDFYFDRSGDLWSLWVLYLESKNIVMVKNDVYEELWVLNLTDFSEVQRPKILVDIRNRIWIFWTGVQKKREEVFYSFYDGICWSKPGRINQKDLYPHIHVDAEIGPDGLPWLVWSSYDGKDYEIYLRYWSPLGWSEQEQITDNMGIDIFPHIDFVWDHVPLVTWIRSGEEKGIFCRYKEGNDWSEEINLVKGYEGFISSAAVVTDRGAIGIVWESEQILDSEIFHFDDLRKKRRYIPGEKISEIIINPSLQDDIYIGFGDSITYGYMDSIPAPEKGYIPRLEEKLDLNYGDSEVINEGNPSEKTLEGLSRISDVLSEYPGRYLLLMEGTNDIITNSITMDTTAFNLEQMAKICLEFGVLPLISTITPRDDLWGYLPFFRQRLYDLNDKIREIPGQLRIPFVDMFYEFYSYQELDQDWKDLLSSDGLHPNEEGYEYMADKWFAEIKDFPFPPVITEGKRAHNRILFNSEPGNLIIWQESPKLSQENIFMGYKVYRKTDSESMNYFREVAFLPISMMVNYTQHFDRNIDLGKDYCYAVCLVRLDDVEGPCSNIVVVGSVK